MLAQSPRGYIKYIWNKEEEEEEEEVEHTKDNNKEVCAQLI